MRRFAFLFAAFMVLNAIGAGTLISLVLRGRGLGGVFGHAGPAAVSALVVLLFLFLLGAIAVTIRGVGRPLGDLVTAAATVANGDYSARVAAQGPPSVRMVGTAFNSMAERLERQDRQRRELMADIAHELRTPLSVIQGRLEGLVDGVYPRDDAQLGQVIEDTRMLARLVDDLRVLAHTESGMLSLQKEPTDIAILAQDVVNSLAGEAKTRGVAVSLDAAADLPLVDLDPLRIREVIANVLTNALRHTPAGGSISVTVTHSAVDGRDGISVTVADTGTGIGLEDLPKVFDRFYKGRSSSGSGLGLTFARNLVRAHGGEMRAESRPGHGTSITFTV
jgi:two-component system OmpR family sensor kinase/two-component system sensor histidine kinase BaeS